MPVFLDAAGTLIRLIEPVGTTYAAIGRSHGIEASATKLEAAFRHAWKQTPPPLYPEGHPPDDDDRSWWKEVVDQTFSTALGQTSVHPVDEALFDELYEHFAKPSVWQLYPEVRSVLEEMRSHQTLWVVSNFDGRLRTILSGLDIADLFEGMIVSSEVGASKPHPRMFEAAIRAAGASPDECLHIGDDAELDAAGARQAGIHAFQVRRPEKDLSHALSALHSLRL
jgi:putative hydrolase of the HAD superfamily